MLTLIALVALTRGPLLSNRAGEPDCGLFLEGVWRWLSYGPRVGEIYSKDLSAGYYWTMAHWLQALHATPFQFPACLNAISFAAALATAPLAYIVARRLLSPAPALAASAIFLCQPSLWWLGIEPHPQGPAIALLLAALWMYLRAWRILPVTEPSPASAGPRADPAAGAGPRFNLPHWAWATAMVATLAAALLLRAEQVLLFPAFPALYWAAARPAAIEPASSDPEVPRWSRWRRAFGAPLCVTGLMLALASGLMLLVRQILLQTPLATTVAYSKAQTGGYLLHGIAQFFRQPAYGLRQALPFATSVGVLTFLVLLAAFALGWRRLGHAWAARWLGLWLACSGVSYLFWFLVLGNNIRHVTLLALPLIWAACDAAHHRMKAVPLMALSAVLIVADLLVLPPSSNITVYASANVPASWRDLHARQIELHTIAARTIEASAAPDAFSRHLDARAPACFLGSYSTPYVLSDVLLSENRLAMPRRLGMRIGPGWSDVLLRDAAGEHWMRFYEMYSSDEFHHLRPHCDAAFSVEYDAQGYHTRYLGKEWATVPLRSVFYPPRPTATIKGGPPGGGRRHP